MRKIIVLFILILFLSGFASAKMFMLEVKGGYFNPLETSFRSDYGSFLMGGGEATLGIFPGLKLWAGGSFITGKGNAGNAVGSRTNIIPIGGGLKYLLSTGPVRFYGGAGITYVQYKLTAPAGDQNDNTIGYVFKVGAIIKVKGPFVIDIFFESHHGSVNPAGTKIKIGGILGGIGIGFESLI